MGPVQPRGCGWEWSRKIRLLAAETLQGRVEAADHLLRHRPASAWSVAPDGTGPATFDGERADRAETTEFPAAHLHLRAGTWAPFY